MTYDDGTTHAQRTAEIGECDYCGLRYGKTKIGDCAVCQSCQKSRTARIKACHDRYVDHAQPEAMGGSVDDVGLIDEGLP